MSGSAGENERNPISETIDEVIIQGILPATDLIDLVITGGSTDRDAQS